jgi:hypothetical protein
MKKKYVGDTDSTWSLEHTNCINPSLPWSDNGEFIGAVKRAVRVSPKEFLDNVDVKTCPYKVVFGGYQSCYVVDNVYLFYMQLDHNYFFFA